MRELDAHQVVLAIERVEHVVAQADRAPGAAVVDRPGEDGVAGSQRAGVDPLDVDGVAGGVDVADAAIEVVVERTAEDVAQGEGEAAGGGGAADRNAVDCQIDDGAGEGEPMRGRVVGDGDDDAAGTVVSGHESSSQHEEYRQAACPAADILPSMAQEA